MRDHGRGARLGRRYVGQWYRGQLGALPVEDELLRRVTRLGGQRSAGKGQGGDDEGNGTQAHGGGFAVLAPRPSPPLRIFTSGNPLPEGRTTPFRVRYPM